MGRRGLCLSACPRPNEAPVARPVQSLRRRAAIIRTTKGEVVAAAQLSPRWGWAGSVHGLLLANDPGPILTPGSRLYPFGS